MSLTDVFAQDCNGVLGVQFVYRTVGLAFSRIFAVLQSIRWHVVLYQVDTITRLKYTCKTSVYLQDLTRLFSEGPLLIPSPSHNSFSIIYSLFLIHEQHLLVTCSVV